MQLEKYKRIAHALAESQRVNAELEARVRQKEQELERNFDKLERLSRKAAVTDERQRIMTDMHDGIGANLISALCLAESGDASRRDIAAILRECIDDLRLTIDSLESNGDELLPALGNFRYRIEGRLARVGIGLEWHVEDLPPLPDPSPRKLLHILRVLQEAVANVLKHAGATRIRLEAAALAHGRGVSIRVSDNGKGLAESGVEGRGLGNMARRATSIGGEVTVSSTGEGTTVELRLPMQ